jgi:hypothetical protein
MACPKYHFPPNVNAQAEEILFVTQHLSSKALHRSPINMAETAVTNLIHIVLSHLAREVEIFAPLTQESDVVISAMLSVIQDQTQRNAVESDCKGLRSSTVLLLIQKPITVTIFCLFLGHDLVLNFVVILEGLTSF